MDQNQTNKLFSWVGALVVLLIVLLVNFLLGLGIFRTRIDLTEDKLYTLSDGTVNILKELDTKVNIRYYRTEDSDVLPTPVQVYIKRVEDILNEYRKRSKGNVEVELLDPEPDSDEEVAALQDGVNRNSINMVDSYYNGLVIQCLDEKVVLPTLDASQETLLEYELSRAVAEVTRGDKPKIAIMTDEPINGGGGAGANPLMGGGPQQTPAWNFPQLLARDYEVETIPISSNTIGEDVDLLLVVHPKAITDRGEYAIDQFIMRGGKVIAFLDPKFYFGQSAQPNPMMGGMGGGNEPSTLKKLLASWGVTFSDSKVLADVAYRTQLQDNRGGRINEPRVLSLNGEAFNTDVPATGSLQNMLMWEAGTFSGTPADGLEKSSLVYSTENSQLVAPSQMFGSDAEKIMSTFSAEGKAYDLAMMLTGKFKTAFPDGQPAAPEGNDDEEEEDAEDEEKEEETPAESLKESSSETTVVLVGDVDMLHDQTFLRPMRNPFTGQQMMQMINTNMVLVQNLLEQMAGNENLIKIRSRTAAQRSFTKLREMDEESDKKFREAAVKGQEEVDAAQRKLSELVQSKGENVSVHNLDPETQKALNETRETFAEAKKKLRKINLDRRKDKEKLLSKVKAANILLMPILVILAGIGLAMIRKSKTAAK